jgi:hypothetical protein
MAFDALSPRLSLWPPQGQHALHTDVGAVVTANAPPKKEEKTQGKKQKGKGVPMIRRISDRMILWLVAAVVLWALLAQPAFIRLGETFEANYSETSPALCPTADQDRGSC